MYVYLYIYQRIDIFFYIKFCYCRSDLVDVGDVIIAIDGKRTDQLTHSEVRLKHYLSSYSYFNQSNALWPIGSSTVNIQ